jgi:hypothetical protein
LNVAGTSFAIIRTLTIEKTGLAMFYHFSQNNSGGSFNFDEKRGLTHHVVIEAANADEANRKGESLGMYFDGAGDCPCCGDRWYETDDYSGEEVATLYGTPVENLDAGEMFHFIGKGREVAVHYADGRLAWF